MMQQYFEVKRGLPRDTLLLFRLGDFFEMFFDDAVVASRLLGLTLTKRQETPMAGLPAHAADNYVSKLLAAGKKVAICDQAEPAKAGKLVRRQLTRILSPGTTLAANQLDAARNHYLVRARPRQTRPARRVARSFDRRIPSRDRRAHREPAPRSHRARSRGAARHRRRTRALGRPRRTTKPRSTRCTRSARDRLVYRAARLSFRHRDRREDRDGHARRAEPAGLRTRPLPSRARPGGCAGLLRDGKSLRETGESPRPAGISQRAHAAARSGDAAQPGDFFLQPRHARRLAAARHQSHGHRRRARVCSNAGSRRPRSICRRSSAARRSSANCSRQPTRLAELHELLGSRPRHSAHSRPAAESSAQSARTRRRPRHARADSRPARGARRDFGADSQLATLSSQLTELPELARSCCTRRSRTNCPTISPTEITSAPATTPELDRLRSLTTDNKTWLSDLERAEQERTGIRSLKVRFTNNFGYYIEITKANLHLVPADYIRRQTTVGGERYVTEALKQKEKEIFHAEENALARELELFNALVAAVLDESIALAHTADALAELDVLAGWALLAREWDYCRPTLDDGDVLEIIDGRHPGGRADAAGRPTPRSRAARARPSCRTTRCSPATMRRSR